MIRGCQVLEMKERKGECSCKGGAQGDLCDDEMFCVSIAMAVTQTYTCGNDTGLRTHPLYNPWL